MIIRTIFIQAITITAVIQATIIPTGERASETLSITEFFQISEQTQFLAAIWEKQLFKAISKKNENAKFRP